MIRMDLGNLDTTKKKDVPLILVHPETGEQLKDDVGNPMTLYLRSIDSPEYIAASDRLAQGRIDDMRREALQGRNRRKGKAAKTEKDSTPLSEEAIELGVAATSGWANMQWNQQPLEFTQEACADLYRRFPWALNQLNDFINDRANFLGN